MKKLSKLLVLALMIGLLTGCKMREEIGFKIDENQKLSFRFVYAMDDEMIDAMINSDSNNENNEDFFDEIDEDSISENTESTNETAITDEMRWEFLKKSVQEDYGEEAKYEKYEADGFKGYVVTKELGNLQDFVTAEETERVSITSDDLDSKKLFAKTENGYKSIMKLDKSSNNMSEISQYQQMGALFDIKFVVTLPNKAISNNATSVSEDGLTLTWDLLTLTNENIDFEFKFGNASEAAKENSTTSSNLMMYLGIGGLILLIIIVLLIIFSKKKESNEKIDSYSSPSDDKFINAIQNDNKVDETESNEFNGINNNHETEPNEFNSINNNHETEPNEFNSINNNHEIERHSFEEVNTPQVNPDPINQFKANETFNMAGEPETNNLEETNNLTQDGDNVVKVEPFDGN